MTRMGQLRHVFKSGSPLGRTENENLQDRGLIDLDLRLREAWLGHGQTNDSNN